MKTLPALFLLLVPLTSVFSQDDRRTFFENLSIDPDGHVCYVEALDSNPLNRIEYRMNGKYVLNLFSEKRQDVTKVEASDYNNDGVADLIYIEKVTGEKRVENITLYRGGEFQQHMRRHLQHALRTASHPLISDQPEEIARAAQIRSTLETVTARSIPPDEIGVYSSKNQFQPSTNKDIRYAFNASDTLSLALRTIVNGDYRVLSREPDIAKKYGIEINILLTVDPSLGKK